MDLSVQIHQEIIYKIPFFQGRSKQFISFIAPLLIPQKFEEDEYVYSEREVVNDIYFCY
jgi:hypothetical protein